MGTDVPGLVRIGVDVGLLHHNLNTLVLLNDIAGGTNTDAVILDTALHQTPSRGILAFLKTPTTPHVTDGIETAVRGVLAHSNVEHGRISSLTIGTTHFVNAIIEQDARRLSRVAILRLSKSFTKEIPPFSDFPLELQHIMNGYYGWADGGLHIDGSEESPIVESQIVQHCRQIKAKGITSIVISGVFSPIDTCFFQEEQVRKIVLRELPSANVVCSAEVSNIGFLERENASILNASILNFATRTINGFRAAMQRLNLQCPLYITQNDGTLIDAASAARLPIRTFSSGPTNSMRGAAYLGLTEISSTEPNTATIVVDIGGTTTDVGVLLPSGFPRQASAYVTVADVKVNFSMPHVESIGLGGGSIVREDDSKLSLGPDSVGHFLTEKAIVFGGDTLTATDIAVAAGFGANVGQPELVKRLQSSTIARSNALIKSKIEAIVDRMKTSPDPLPVLLVGGGALISPNELSGVSKLIRPPFHMVANAVGAAISKIGGSVDITRDTSNTSSTAIVEEAKILAIERAVSAGADRNTVTIAEVHSIPITYIANRLRVVIRAVGELSNSGCKDTEPYFHVSADEDRPGDVPEAAKVHKESEQELTFLEIDSYQPKVVTNAATGFPEWILSETDLAWLADGCYVLGCAGGGSPFPEFIMLRDQIRQGYTHRVVDISALSKEALIYCKSPWAFGEIRELSLTHVTRGWIHGIVSYNICVINFVKAEESRKNRYTSPIFDLAVMAPIFSHPKPALQQPCCSSIEHISPSADPCQNIIDQQSLSSV